jgi:hypothetical protein
MERNKINILCTMVARNEFKQKELTCATCLLVDNINLDRIEEISEMLEDKINEIMVSEGPLIILHLYSDFERKVDYERYYYDKSNMIYVQIGILDYLFGRYSEFSLFSHIYQNTGTKEGKIYKNVLFIFTEISWSNIVLIFKLNDIILYGGNSNSRHKISLKDLKLLEYLKIFTGYNYSYLEYVLIQNMKNVKNMEPYINKDIYIKVKDTNNFNVGLNTNTNIITEYKDELYLENKKVIDNFLFYNEHFINKLKFVLNLSEKKKIKYKLEKEISNLKSLEGVKNDLNIGGLTKYQARLEKKRFQEYNKYNIYKKELEQIKEELINLEKQIEIKGLSKELVAQISIDLEKSLYTNKTNLLKYRKYPSKDNKSSFLESSNLNDNKIQNKNLIIKREYHSSSILALSNKDNKISNQISNNQIINFMVDSGLNIEKYSINNSRELQEEFENLWLLKNKSQLDNKEFLEKKLSFLTVNFIKEAYKTLNILYINKEIGKKFKNIEEELNDIELIFLTYSLLVSYYNRMSLTALSMSIGNYILIHLFKKRFRVDFYKNKNQKEIKENTNEISQINSHLLSFEEFKKLIEFSEIKTVILGDFFISIFCQYPSNIFEREFMIENYYSNTGIKLKINPIFLDEIKENLIISPTVLPMLCKPNLWSDDNYGGLLGNAKEKKSIITGSIQHKHKMENKKVLYSAINYFNSIKFKINKLFLNYILNEGNYLLEIDALDPLQRKITLIIAEFLNILDHMPFYLSTVADWRGRIYTQSFYITYQGNELSTALLDFWEGEALNEYGLYYLKIYGANNHNEDNLSKKSIVDKIKWVDIHYDKIINLDRELISSAENKFIFAAFCLNMRLYHNNPEAKIYTPVFLDATCSGIQHLAALMLDLELGKKVNLSPITEKDKPEDIYSSLIEPINLAINKLGETDIKYSHFKDIKLNRKILKQSIMTKVYNVTQFGMKEQIKGKLKKVEIKKDLNNKIFEELLLKLQIKDSKTKIQNLFEVPSYDKQVIYVSDSDIFKIAKIIDQEIFILFPSLNYIYNYFIDISKLMIKLEIPLTWITPAGMKITQHYLKSKQKTLAIRFGGKTKKMILRESTVELNKSKQIQAIIPNIIHSLDANHIINLINNAQKEEFYPIITIHDCFGTLPNKMVDLENKVKTEFILLYTNDPFLSKFHNKIIESIKDNNYEIIETNNNKILSNKVFIEATNE